MRWDEGVNKGLPCRLVTFVLDPDGNPDGRSARLGPTYSVSHAIPDRREPDLELRPGAEVAQVFAELDEVHHERDECDYEGTEGDPELEVAPPSSATVDAFDGFVLHAQDSSERPGGIMPKMQASKCVRPVPHDSLSMGTAETSLLVSSIAAVGSVGAVITTYRLGVLRFNHERKQADRADGRETLAVAALALGRAKSEMKTALTAYQEGLNSGDADAWPEEEEFWSQMRGLEVQAEALEAALAGVRIRLKQNAAVVVELAGTVEKLRSILTVYFLSHAGRGDKHGDGTDHTEALALSQEWDSHRDAYLDAAQELVGVALAD